MVSFTPGPVIEPRLLGRPVRKRSFYTSYAIPTPLRELKTYIIHLPTSGSSLYSGSYPALPALLTRLFGLKVFTSTLQLHHQACP